ncbi:peptidylprolyl isomerase, partial [Mycobacterium tuberculosis]
MSLRYLTGLALAAALIPLATDAAPKKAKPAVAAAVPAPADPTDADFRTPNPNNLLVIDTNKGRIVVEMYPEIAPATVAQIQALAKRHFY